MPKVRTRYAPSPTGVPHIGNLRTALFNFLFAQNQKGEFILRVEDTDQKRSTKIHIANIENSLDVLGIKYDNKFQQSQRLEIYHKHLDVLKNKGLVYEDEGAWRFKIDTKTESVSWKDSVHGEVNFPASVVEDFIIVKSDGFPTYHFASVVDDHAMEITHVIRGDEWISSTPKHLLLYKAFGWQHPNFSHVPVILGPDKKKLSKREGANSAMEYIKEGYLKEALINYLALLGWSPKNNQEIFAMDELTREFSLERLNKNNPIFDIEKLKWINGQWIRKMDAIELAPRIKGLFESFSLSQIEEYLPLVKDRMSTILDFDSLAGGFFKKPNIKKLPKLLVSVGTILALAKKYDQVSESRWNTETITQITNDVMQSYSLTKAQLYRSIGIAALGSTVTPPLFPSLEKLGKTETVSRLRDIGQKV